MAGIIVKDGALWKDGVKLELEFGNVEQIQALRAYEQRIQEFLDGEVEPNCHYEIAVTAFASFECICGNKITSQTDADDEDEVDCFDSTREKCRKCNRVYQFIVERVYKNNKGKPYLDYENLSVKFLPDFKL